MSQDVPIRDDFNFLVAFLDKHLFRFARGVLVGSAVFPPVCKIAGAATSTVTFDVMPADS